MVKRLSECDPNRLRSFLDDELSARDQAELAGHLDQCADCQAALERLAAGTRLWDDLRGLGRTPGRAMPELPIDPGAGASSGIELGFLTPSESPDSLGRLGPYEIIGVLGQGGMGVVLKAFEPALSRVVAIKVLAPQMAASGAARNRFSREAKAAAAVVHDHVVAIHAVDVDPKSGLPYLVMPYIAGRSLQQRIDGEGPLRIEEILRIGMQTALGLSAAHAQGLVHRDIKPSNILLENGVERVKITDFGLARAIDDASQSQSGVVAGTPQYMSPEQASGESVDHRSDLFSLGSVLYAMCAGHSPFRAKTTMGVLRRVCDEEPRPLVEVNPEVPECLEAVIRRLHAKDPANRYQAAAEVAEVLGRQLAELQRPGSRPTRPAPTPPDAGVPAPSTCPAAKPAGLHSDWDVRAARRRPRLARVGGIALVGCLGLAALAMMMPGETTPSARFAPLSGAVRPAWVSVAVPPQDGRGETPARVIITTQDQDDRSTIIGSGKPATKRFDLADFNGVEIANTFRATITRADRFEVSVTADDNVLDHVRVDKDGSRLRVRLEGGRTYRLRPDTLNVSVALPVLEALHITGASRAKIEGFQSDRPFHLDTSGASTLEGSIKAGDADFEASGASTVKLQGSARAVRLHASGASTLELADFPVSGEKLTIEADGASTVRLRGSAKAAVLKASGASHFELAELALDAADVELSGASDAAIRVKDLLNYDVSGASHLEYRGEPTIKRAAKSGVSSVSHRP
jgi:serine/threonine-protein kinase